MSDNSNFKIDCLSSSKYPPCDAGVKNLLLEGYLATPVKAGVAVFAGNLLIQSAVANKTVLLASGAGDKRVIGVAVKEAALGASVLMAVEGEFLVLVNNTVVAGDFLAASATAGVAASTGLTGAVGDFAVATSSGVGSGPQPLLISARFKKVELA
jgi:hypothetical protein